MLYSCLTMRERTLGPRFPALVVIGHVVTLILFWQFRKNKKQGKVCVILSIDGVEFRICIIILVTACVILDLDLDRHFINTMALRIYVACLANAFVKVWRNLESTPPLSFGMGPLKSHPAVLYTAMLFFRDERVEKEVGLITFVQPTRST